MRLGRRDVLRGLLTAPFLAATARAAAAGPAGNFLVFFTPNGFARAQLGADVVNGALSLRPSLQGLSPFASKLAVLTGLCLKSCDLNSGSHENIVQLLTCRPVSPGSYTASGPSIDTVIAQRLGTTALNLAADPVRGDAPFETQVSYRGAGVPSPISASPAQTYASLSSELTSTAPGTLDARRLAQRKSVLDYVRGDLATLKARVGTADRQRLELHLAALREVERKLDAAGASATGCDGAAAQSAGQAALPSEQIARLKASAERQADLIALAFACGVRRSATLVMGASIGGVDPSGSGYTHHDVTHFCAGDGPAGHCAELGTRRPAIDRWYADRFGYLLSRLESLGVLETTMVVWCTEISQEHSPSNFTTVVAGGSALGLKLGQRLAFPFHGSDDAGAGNPQVARDPRNRSLADLWATAQAATGGADAPFGDPGFSGGPLPELFARP